MPSPCSFFNIKTFPPKPQRTPLWGSHTNLESVAKSTSGDSWGQALKCTTKTQLPRASTLLPSGTHPSSGAFQNLLATLDTPAAQAGLH